MVLDLIYNLSVLAALSGFSGFVNTRLHNHTLRGKIIQGLLFGIVSIIGMMNPFKLNSDVIFDGRSVVISLCTLFYGPISGLLSSILSILFRLQLGGGGAFTGVLVITASFLIGYFAYHYTKKTNYKHGKTSLYVFGFVVSLVMMGLMITLPTHSIKNAFAKVTLTVMFGYPIITMLIGKMLLDHFERARAEETIIEENKKLLLTKLELNNALSHLNLHLNNSPLAVIEFDKDFRIISWSDRANEIFKWTKEEVIGKKISQLKWVLEDDIEKIEILSQRMSEKLSPSNININRNYTKEEKIITCAWYNSALYDSDGNLSSIYSFVEDITEAQKLQEQIRKLSQATEQSPASIVITDLQGKIEYVNAKFCQITGYSLLEVIGQNPRILKSGELASSEYKALWDTLFSGEEWFGVFHNKKKDGTFFWERAQISPIKNEDGTITHFIAVKEDITDNVIKEKELEEYREHLEELVEIRTIELDTINQQLNESLENEKELNKLKSRFISTASHEFRTPLTSVLASSEMIERYFDRWGKDKVTEHLHRIQKSALMLTKLMDDVIMVNRAESGKTRLQPGIVDLRSLSLKAINDVEIHAIDNHEILFHYEADRDNFQLDPKQIELILHNLLSNAIKYSPNGGKIYFNVYADNGNIEFKISDTGIGISDEDLPRLFESFHRATNAIDIQGTGLGLSIVKHAVELHEGKILVDSKLGIGTTFKVIIPILS